MNRPLALLAYEKLFPGTQLANRLQDLGYRVMPVGNAAELSAVAEREKPLVVLVDIEPNTAQRTSAIAALRASESTAHIPVIAFASARNEAAQEQARQAGATLVVHDNSILAHLNQFLDQALLVE